MHGVCSKNKDGDQVLVTIKRGEENSTTQNGDEVSNSLNNLPSGSYCFSNYLPVDTSLVSELGGVVKNITTSTTQVPTLTSLSSVEIINSSPAVVRSPRVPGVTRPRSCHHFIQSLNPDYPSPLFQNWCPQLPLMGFCLIQLHLLIIYIMLIQLLLHQKRHCWHRP